MGTQTHSPPQARACAQRVEMGSEKVRGRGRGVKSKEERPRQETWLTRLFKELTGPQPAEPKRRKQECTLAEGLLSMQSSGNERTPRNHPQGHRKPKDHLGGQLT